MLQLMDKSEITFSWDNLGWKNSQLTRLAQLAKLIQHLYPPGSYQQSHLIAQFLDEIIFSAFDGIIA